MTKHTFTIQTTLFKTVTKTEEVNNSITCYLWDNKVISYKLGKSIEFKLKLDLYQYTNKSLPNEEYSINGMGTTKHVINTEYDGLSITDLQEVALNNDEYIKEVEVIQNL